LLFCLMSFWWVSILFPLFFSILSFIWALHLDLSIDNSYLSPPLLCFFLIRQILCLIDHFVFFFVFGLILSFLDPIFFFFFLALLSFLSYLLVVGILINLSHCLSSLPFLLQYSPTFFVCFLFGFGSFLLRFAFLILTLCVPLFVSC
jgi:hypothetical protein